MGKLSKWKHLKAEMQSRAVMTNWRGNGVAESSNPPPFLKIYNHQINSNKKLIKTINNTDYEKQRENIINTSIYLLRLYSLFSNSSFNRRNNKP